MKNFIPIISSLLITLLSLTLLLEKISNYIFSSSMDRSLEIFSSLAFWDFIYKILKKTPLGKD